MKKLIGLSVSLCILDMLKGDVDPNNVSHIICGTRMQNPADLNKVFKQYSESYWKEFEYAKVMELWANFIAGPFYDGQLNQPRLLDNDAYCNIGRGHWFDGNIYVQVVRLNGYEDFMIDVALSQDRLNNYLDFVKEDIDKYAVIGYAVLHAHGNYNYGEWEEKLKFEDLASRLTYFKHDADHVKYCEVCGEAYFWCDHEYWSTYPTGCSASIESAWYQHAKKHEQYDKIVHCSECGEEIWRGDAHYVWQNPTGASVGIDQAMTDHYEWMHTQEGDK